MLVCQQRACVAANVLLDADGVYTSKKSTSDVDFFFFLVSFASVSPRAIYVNLCVRRCQPDGHHIYLKRPISCPDHASTKL